MPLVLEVSLGGQMGVPVSHSDVGMTDHFLGIFALEIYLCPFKVKNFLLCSTVFSTQVDDCRQIEFCPGALGCRNKIFKTIRQEKPVALVIFFGQVRDFGGRVISDSIETDTMAENLFND
jgi:hypothetical protein